MSTDTPLLFSPFRLERANQQLWRDEAFVPLRPKSFAVLRYLVEHPGRLVTRQELQNAIWPGIYVSDGLLRGYIRELREILADDAETPRFIETVPRRGYRFLAPVTLGAAAVSGPEFQAPNLNTQQSILNTQHSLLVGREAELAQLHKWLARAAGGERQLVFVTGEPGIGKTSLVEMFFESLGQRGTGNEERATGKGQEGVRSWELGAGFSSPQTPGHKPQASEVMLGWGQCVEHYGVREAYLPILDSLGRLCRQPGGEPLIRTLYQYAPTWLVQMPSLVHETEFELLQRKVQGGARERMLRELAEALEAFTADRLLVLALEDLHWCDYSTLDLIGVLARRRELARLCIIGTYRPADLIVFDHPLRGLKQELHSHRLCNELALSFLTEHSVTVYLTHRFPSEEANDHSSLLALARSIHEYADGNPLFMVNLVDYWTSERTLPDTSRQRRPSTPGIETERGIPESLRLMVEKQLERLTMEEQQALEVASVAGDEFSAATLVVGDDTQVEQMEECCEGLAARGQFVRFRSMATLPNGSVTGRYRFLHTIYQQILYERLPAIRRIRLHRALGEKMEQLWDARAPEYASALAVHFERGQAYQQAGQYLWLAAENARRKHAYHETVALLTKSLDLLQAQPDSLERRQQELALLVALGVPLLMTKGYAAPEVEQTYSRARQLSLELGESPQFLPALTGLFRFHFVRANFTMAQEIAEQVLRLAQQTSDSLIFLIAHSLLAVPFASRGAFTSAREHFDKGVSLYDRQQHQFMASVYGDDPGITCLSLRALSLWFLGYPDQALHSAQEGFALARDLGLPYNVAFASDILAWLHFYRGEYEAAQACLDLLFPLVNEQGFEFFAAESQILQGWVLTEQGRGDDGLARMCPGISAYQATGAEMSRPSHISLLARTYGRVGQANNGLVALDEAFAIINRTGEFCLAAELSRLKGELLLQQLQVQNSAQSRNRPQGVKGKKTKG